MKEQKKRLFFSKFSLKILKFCLAKVTFATIWHGERAKVPFASFATFAKIEGGERRKWRKPWRK
jgi:hypothetical protein